MLGPCERYSGTGYTRSRYVYEYDAPGTAAARHRPRSGHRTAHTCTTKIANRAMVHSHTLGGRICHAMPCHDTHHSHTNRHRHQIASRHRSPQPTYSTLSRAAPHIYRHQAQSRGSDRHALTHEAATPPPTASTSPSTHRLATPSLTLSHVACSGDQRRPRRLSSRLFTCRTLRIERPPRVARPRRGAPPLTLSLSLSVLSAAGSHLRLPGLHLIDERPTHLDQRVLVAISRPPLRCV